MSIRVRFAPSPTGFLHVGGARTALFNWLLARQAGGVFILRIEDTDRARSSEEMVQAILDSMRWLGLDWDEGPYFQSEGLERHQADARRLLAEGKAYPDFATPEELAEERARHGKTEHHVRMARRRYEAMSRDEVEDRMHSGQPHAIRFRVPEGETRWDDLVHGAKRFANDQIDDMVILRGDGSPIYNLAVTSDDAHMGVTHVVRGDDHISNTPKQILLYQALDRAIPVFGHLPMILGPDGKRLSKRHGATAVGEYEAAGTLPWAMMNFLALLGWSPGDDQEVMPVDELLARFSMDRVLRGSAVFDVQKLEWLNGRHISECDAEILRPLVASRLVEGGHGGEGKLAEMEPRFLELLNLLKSRTRTLEELARQAVPYLARTVSYDAAAVKKHWKHPKQTAESLVRLRTRFAEVEWDEAALEEALRGLAEELGVGAGKLIHPLRVALTGQAVSPGIFEVMTFLGAEQVAERVGWAVAALGRMEEHREG